MIRIKRFLQFLRLLPILPWIQWQEPLFKRDLQRWKAIQHRSESDVWALAIMLWELPELRNLLIYRNRFRRLYRMWIALWYHPMETLYIQTPQIGGGLYIQHGFATMIAAKAIGEDAWINQQVTVGYGKGAEPPVIGDRVTITCGAKVLGEIRVGDDVVIGANAVVVRDVESGCVMGGVPAKVIRRKEQRYDQQ